MSLPTSILSLHMYFVQTKDIIEYLKRLSKTSIPDGIEQFIKVSKGLWCSVEGSMEGSVVL